MLIQRLTIIGVGLIGGSLARALKRMDATKEIVGCGRNTTHLKHAIQLGVIDRYDTNPANAVKDADLIIIAVPLGSIAKVFDDIRDALAPHAIITDVGSAKSSVITDAKQHLGHHFSRFVPGHPIAGTEKSGVTASFAELFQNRRVILTPLPETNIAATTLVTKMWEKTGAEVVNMLVQHHDEVLAATSHLPHLLAYSLVDTLATLEDKTDIFKYAAGGFRDFTRIASSDPHMWHDICFANKEAILKVLAHFKNNLAQLETAIQHDDSQHIEHIFTRAKTARDKHFERKTTFIVKPGGTIQGHCRVPGDKSISHRAIMLGAIAEGTTKITGFLEGEDTLASLAAFTAMGVSITQPLNGKLSIQGVGLHGLKAPKSPLYLGNSGTSMRLLSGLMAGQRFSVEMTGDASLTRRPMRRVTDPLTQMGAHIDTTGTPPLKIQNTHNLQGIDYTMPIASAQVKSCLLLAGLYAKGTTSITEIAPTRDHTERMLAGFAYPVKRKGQRISIQGGATLKAMSIDVPADISSAAFFMVGASIAPGSKIILEHVGINPTRTGVIEILRQMGANISLHHQRNVGGEPVADIQVCASPLHGIHIPQDQVPLAIDEFPALFIAAACAHGETILTGAQELRVKESDRIQVMAEGLQAIGINAQATEDGMIIQGGQIQGGVINSHGDHRIAMAFTIAALRAKKTITIKDCANVATSFPNFVTLAQTAGINFSHANL